MPAAAHLYGSDPDRARGTCIYAISLTKNGRLDDAEGILRGYIEQYGENGSVLTNLAKVYSARKEPQQVQATLWRALEVDPNQENGLAWYVALSRENNKEAAEAAWTRVAAIPTSWRAQLWLARTALESGDLSRALALYEESLSRAGNSPAPDLLMQMSGDLGKHGALRELLRLAEPVFDPEKQGLNVGNNLIKANLDLGRIEEAARVLNQLFALRRPDWKQQLNFWDTEIAKARTSKATTPNNPSMAMLIIEGPVWLDYSSPLRKLFPPKPDGSPIISLIGSSVDGANPSNDRRYAIADAPGRMSRTLPLFLAEQIELKTGFKARTLVPWLAGQLSAFVVSGVPGSDVDAANYARQAQPNSQYAATIHLKTAAEPWRAQVRIIRLLDGQCTGDFSVVFPADAPHDAVSKLAARFIKLLMKSPGAKVKHVPPIYQVPKQANFSNYLLRLEQLLAVRCAGMDQSAAGILSGEREILDGNLNLCLTCKDNFVTRAVLMRTFKAMNKVHPEIVAEFRSKLKLLQREFPLERRAQDVIEELLAEIG